MNPNPIPNNPNPINPNPPAAAGGGGGGGNGGNGGNHPDEPRDPRFFWLTVGQYAVIFAVTIFFVWVLGSFKNIQDLKDPDTARGLITFVIAVGTIAIAIMLALTAILTREFEKRFAVGKEVLTILVGVLGTIVGFYYGAAAKNDAAQPGANAASAQISAAPIKVPEQIENGGTVSLSTTLSGGTPPYRYSITFTPDSIPAIPETESANGDISHEFKASVPAGTDSIGFVIDGKDKNGTAFALNKDGKQKILVR